MQSVPITTDVVSSNLDQSGVYNIMTKTCDRSVAFSGYSVPPRYNCNIVESGVKHHQAKTMIRFQHSV